MNFVKVPSCYNYLVELRKSNNNISLIPNKYLKPDLVLRHYQIVGIIHFLKLTRMVLGDSTGLGKTIQAIVAYTYLLNQDPNLKLIVICPKSAILQWKEEFEKFTTGISVRPIVNEYKKLKDADARDLQYSEFSENVLIVNYAIFRNEYERIKEILNTNYMVIFDECTEFKNRKTLTHMAAKYLANSAKYVYGLSATIIKNGLEEVYSIYDVIVPGLFGRITKFKETFCIQTLIKVRIHGRDRYIPKISGYKNLDVFKKTIDPYFLIRKKEDVAKELPKLISRKILLEMTPEQKVAYRKALLGILQEEKIMQEYATILDMINSGRNDENLTKKYEELQRKYSNLKRDQIKQRSKLAALTYCQMVSNAPVLVNEKGNSSKEEEFIRLITEELVNDKIIVFTRFKSYIPYLEVICERKNIKYTKITGDLNDKERQQARLTFQNDPNCRIIFITTAGSASLNLQAASCIIFYDTPWSYGDLVQTIGRAQRIGSLQDHIMIIHLVNKNSIDEKVINKVSDKKHLSDEILGVTAEGALDFISNEESVVDDLYVEILKDAQELSSMQE